jgi:hypothetical protein
MRNMKKIIGSTIAVAAIAGITATPANARNLLDYVRGFTGGSSTSNAQVQSVMSSNFSTRQQQLRSQIASSVASGTMHPNSASALTAQLDQINSMTAAFAGGGFTNSEAQQIVDAFTNVTNQVNASTSTYSNYPTTYTYPYGTSYPYGYNNQYYSPNLFNNPISGLRDLLRF